VTSKKALPNNSVGCLLSHDQQAQELFQEPALVAGLAHPFPGLQSPTPGAAHPVPIGPHRVLAGRPGEGNLYRVQRHRDCAVGEAGIQTHLNLGHRVFTGGLHDARDPGRCRLRRTGIATAWWMRSRTVVSILNPQSTFRDVAIG
jgi:hypothetical protein